MTVNLGDKVTTVGNSAFIGCKAVTEVILPDSVTNLGNDVL